MIRLFNKSIACALALSMFFTSARDAILPSPASARDLTAREQQAYDSVKAYLEDYYQNRDGTPGISGPEQIALNKALENVRDEFERSDDVDNWNAGDGIPDVPDIPYWKPPDHGDPPKLPDDPYGIEKAVKKEREEKMKEMRRTSLYNLDGTEGTYGGYKRIGDQYLVGNKWNAITESSFILELGFNDSILITGSEFSGSGKGVDEWGYINACMREVREELESKIPKDSDIPVSPPDSKYDKTDDFSDIAGDVIGDKDNGVTDQLPFLGDISEALDDPGGFIFDKVWDKVLDKALDKVPISTVVKAILDVGKDRFKDHRDAFWVELPVIVGAGIAMAVAAGIAYGIATAFKDKSHWVEVVSLVAIVAFDGALYGTKKSTWKKIEEWTGRMRSDYASDHVSMSEVVARSQLPKIMSIQAKMAVPGGASFAVYGSDFGARFNEIHPGYGGSGTGLYMDDYKTTVRNWKNYAAAFKLASEAEETDVADLYGLIQSLESVQKGDKGYRQALQARNQTYAAAIQQVSNLRLDIARQIDLRSRRGLDKEQKDADLHVAFERAATGGWTPSASGDEY